MSILSTPPGTTEAGGSGLESARAQRTLGGGEPATTLSREQLQYVQTGRRCFHNHFSVIVKTLPHLHCSMTLPPVVVVTPGPGWSCSWGGCRGSTSSTPLDRARDPHQDSAVHTYRPAIDSVVRFIVT